MKKQISILLLSFLFIKGRAQQVISVAGAYATAEGVQLNWNLGEIRTLSTFNYVWFTEGVSQPSNGTVNQLPSFADLPVLNSVGLDNAGTTFTNTANGNNLVLEFTLGEMASRTLTGNNTMVTQGILQPYTLQNNSPLPVLGLDFTAKRLNAQQVQLNWRTQQEIANKGFTIQRKRETEPAFTNEGFTNSKATNGSSTTPLDYTRLDTNAYTGRTYYRLKQEDLNGAFTYSVVRLVEGNPQQNVTLRAWPIPAPKDFSVMVTGVQKDVVLLYDAAGRLVKQTAITEGEVVNIIGLKSGTYFLKLKTQSDLTQKISVQ